MLEKYRESQRLSLQTQRKVMQISDARTWQKSSFRPMNSGTRAIQEWIWSHYGFIANSAWIAHCKELNGLPVNARQRDKKRRNPCPASRRAAIEEAFREFGLMPKAKSSL